MPRSRAAGALCVCAVLVAASGAARAGGPGDATILRGVPYAQRGGSALRLDAYLPAARNGRVPAVIFVHGGAWHSGDRREFETQATELARHDGFAAFAIDYRAEPPARFPAAIADVAAAVSWVRGHAGEYRVDGARIGIWGESAGANLAAVVAARGRGRIDRGSRVRAVVSWSGPLDLRALAGSRDVSTYIGCRLRVCPGRYRQASATSYVDRTDPAVLLINSAHELVPLSQPRGLARLLARAGVPHRLTVLPGNRHGLAYAATAFAPSLAFLRARLR